MTRGSTLPPRTDVAIVGGGFAGMATAWALGRRGVADVLVLEREAELGRYASGRSAGLGRQLAESDAMTALTVRGAAVLRTEFSQAWTPTGGLLTFDNVEHAQEYVDRAARFGIAIEPVSRELVLGHWPELAAVEIAAALHVPSDGVIDVGTLLAAYAAGARYTRGCAVETVEATPGGARLVTNHGVLAARVVVDAAGAWAGRTTGDPLLASFKRHVYVLEITAPARAPYVWHVGARELYVRESGGGIMVSPCDATPTLPGDQKPDGDGEAKLRRVLAGSSLAPARVGRAWACQRTFAPEHVGPMQLGRDPARPWLVWAAGLAGHGATSSAAVGETVADAVIAALCE